MKTHILGAKTLTLSPANDTVSAGGYAGTTLSVVDADLAAGNIKYGVTIFGVIGTSTDSLPAPDVGGAWLWIPGTASLGTRGFWVQKYEAKNVGNMATSQASGTPWASITQTEAKNRCEALGPGYHLVTIPEVLTISRDVENNGWNWTGGSVGSGGLWRGNTDGSPASALAADVTGDPDDDPYVGTGNSSPSIEKRVYQLSTGEYIWDWAGNLWEWVNLTCNSGSGAGYWYGGAAWIEWTDANLSDYEKVRSGPAGAYTSAQYAGKYYGCVAAGNAAMRGGGWSDSGGAHSGMFALSWNSSPSASGASLGFRCAR